MNLRQLVLALLVANLAFWSWSQGWWRDLGWGPAVQTEPERLTRQVNPDALRLGPPRTPPAGTRRSTAQSQPIARSTTPDTSHPPEAAAPPAHATAPTPAAATTCMQAGPFDARQIDALRSAVASLPAKAWHIESTQVAGRWMVYVGPLAGAGAVASKRTELRELGVDVDRPGAAFEPGLSLGRYSTPEAAARALEELGRKGVRTAHVVVERAEASAHTLHLPRVDEALRSQLERSPLIARALRNCA